MLKSGAAVANALYHSTGGGWTENNENVFVSPTGRDRRGAGLVPAGVARPGTGRDLVRRGVAVRDLEDGRVLADGAGRDLQRGRRGPRPGPGSGSTCRGAGVSGRLISVTLTGSLGTKTVSGDVFRSVFNAAKPAADPQMRSTLFDTRPIP